MCEENWTILDRKEQPLHSLLVVLTEEKRNVVQEQNERAIRGQLKTLKQSRVQRKTLAVSQITYSTSVSTLVWRALRTYRRLQSLFTTIQKCPSVNH